MVVRKCFDIPYRKFVIDSLDTRLNTTRITDDSDRTSKRWTVKIASVIFYHRFFESAVKMFISSDSDRHRKLPHQLS